MLKLARALTIYVVLSFMIFLATSFTINGWIFYGLLLPPVYVAILLPSWIIAWQNRTKTAHIRHWIWNLTLGLQSATILSAPGNCYGTTQGARCYSNLQILFGNVPRQGLVIDQPHWTLVEDAFLGLLIMYAVTLGIGVFTVFIQMRRPPDPQE